MCRSIAAVAVVLVAGLVVASSSTLGLNEPAAAAPQANTKFGRVRGVWLETLTGRSVAGFVGLPYAEPPVGHLRFENTVPWTRRWDGIRNATTDGSACLQISKGKMNGDEDCLFINVFTPINFRKKKADKSEKRLPVIAYVHGGSFVEGSSNTTEYAPTYLLDHDVVLVTFNYRLNVLGFFSTGNRVAPGNYGLKDQVTALKWVRDNIDAFGGNAESVTLVGLSAGSASVHLLTTSTATQGLFHRIMTMSGSANAPWAFHSRDSIRNSSITVAHKLKCDYNSSLTQNFTTALKGMTEEAIDQRMVQCLKNVAASDIVAAGTWDQWRGNPFCVFGPTLEANSEGAVLTVNPAFSVEQGLVRDMPWLAGVTRDEGLIKAPLFLTSYVKAEFIERFQDVLPYVLEFDRDLMKDMSSVAKDIEDFYFGGKITSKMDEKIVELVGDAFIYWPAYDAIEKQSAKRKSNIYFYVFSYEGTFSSTFDFGLPFYFGVNHADDINYLFPRFNRKFSSLRLNNTLSDLTTIGAMCEMLANFAVTGEPSVRPTTHWEPYQKQHRYMMIGNGTSTEWTLQSNFLPERMNFWSRLMANYSAPIKESFVEDGNGTNGIASKKSSFLLCTVLIGWSIKFCNQLIRDLQEAAD